jgi:hypothetical protein
MSAVPLILRRMLQNSECLWQPRLLENFICRVPALRAREYKDAAWTGQYPFFMAALSAKCFDPARRLKQQGSLTIEVLRHSGHGQIAAHFHMHPVGTHFVRHVGCDDIRRKGFNQ